MLLFEWKNEFHRPHTRSKFGGQIGPSRPAFLFGFFLGHHLFQAQHFENIIFTIKKILVCVPEEPRSVRGQRSRKQIQIQSRSFALPFGVQSAFQLHETR
jgi:hypothetical protein